MKQRKQFLNSLGLSSPHLSQHLLRLLLLLVTAIGGVGSSWAEDSTSDLAIIKTGIWTAPTSSTSQPDAIQATSYDLDGGDSSLKYVYVNKSGTNTNGVQTKIGTSSSDRHIAIKVGERTTTVTITHNSNRTRYMAYTDGDSSDPVRGKGNVSSTQTVFVLTGSAEGKIYYIGGAETENTDEYKGSDLYVSKIEFSVAGDDPAPQSSECDVTGVSYTTLGGTKIDGVKNENANEWFITVPGNDNGNKKSETNYYFDITLSPKATVGGKTNYVLKKSQAPSTQNITVTAEDGTTKEWTITVLRAASSIELNKNILYIPHDGQEQLTATVLPDKASNKNVNWSTGDGNIATVSNGLVKGKTTYDGHTTISATAADGNGASATCDVYVYRFSIAGNQTTTYNVGDNGVGTLVQASFPDADTFTINNNDFKVESSKPDVVNITSWTYTQNNGRLSFTPTVGQAGTATITITYTGSNTNYNGTSCTINYTVKAPTIGEDNCSSTWINNVTSNAVALEIGKTVTFSFTNHNNSTGSEWNNWNIVSGTTGKADTGNSTVLRSDVYYWGNGKANNAGGYANKSGDWSTMSQANMDGAHVDVMVSKYDDHVVSYYAVMTLKDGKKAMMDLSQYYSESPTPTYAWLRVDASYITDLEVTTSDIVYRTVTTSKNDNDGGTVTAKVKDTNTDLINDQVINGTTVAFTVTPAEWYQFDGWYVGQTKVGEATTYETSVTSDLSVQAAFTRYYKVNVLANNAAYGNVTLTGGTNNEAIKKGTSITLNASANTGYKFTKWTVEGTDKNWGAEASNKVENLISGVADKQIVTITAIFEPTATNHTITFNANGGSGTMDAQQVEDNVATAINANTFSGAMSFNFVGWNTAEDGSGTDYAPGANITLTNDIVLYAQWFRFSPQGSQTPTVVVGQTKEGYNFYFKATKNFMPTTDEIEISSSNTGIATATLRNIQQDYVRINVQGVAVGTADITVKFKGREGTLYGETSPVVTFTVKAADINTDLLTIEDQQVFELTNTDKNYRGYEWINIANQSDRISLADGGNTNIPFTYPATYISDDRYFYLHAGNGDRLEDSGFDGLKLNGNPSANSGHYLEMDVHGSGLLTLEVWNSNDRTIVISNSNTFDDASIIATQEHTGNSEVQTYNIIVNNQGTRHLFLGSKGGALRIGTFKWQPFAKPALAISPTSASIDVNDASKKVSDLTTMTATIESTSAAIENPVYKYRSSDTSVAIVDENTGAITPVAAGQTTITIQLQSDGATHGAQTAELALTVEGTKKKNVTMNFSSNLAFTTVDAIPDVPTLTIKDENGNDLSVAVTYSIEAGTTGLSVNASTGALSGTLAAGTATVTAIYAGNETYKSATATYTITIASGKVVAPVITFTADGGDASYSVLAAKPAKTVTKSSKTINYNDATQVYVLQNFYNENKVSTKNKIHLTIESPQAGITIKYKRDSKALADDTSFSETYASTPVDVSMDKEQFISIDVTVNGEHWYGYYQFTNVPEPTITPDGQNAAGYTSRNVTVSTSLSGGTMYYTLDGSDATTTSTAYSSPINLTDSKVVKAATVYPGTLFADGKDFSTINAIKTVFIYDPTIFMADASAGSETMAKKIKGGDKVELNGGKLVVTFGNTGKHNSQSGYVASTFTPSEAANEATTIPSYADVYTDRQMFEGDNPQIENGTYATMGTEDGGTLFKTPIGGVMYRFEPTSNGVVTFWARQNGALDYKNGVYSIARRPVYIMDEDGVYIRRNTNEEFTDIKQINGVEAHISNLSTFGTDPANAMKHFEQTAPEDANYKYFADKYGENIKPTDKIGDIIYSETEVDANGVPMYGWECPEKNFVRYSFPVKAGKTYYLGGKATKVGFSAVKFDELPTTSTDVTIDHKSTIGLPSMTVGQQYNVTLNRKFTGGKWNALVLPFSVSETQLAEVFGGGVEVMFFENMPNSNTFKVLRHFYQMIYANVPCLVRPKDDVSDPEFTNVTYAGSTIREQNIGYDYKVTGSYKKTVVKQYDYVTSWDDEYDLTFFQATGTSESSRTWNATRGWITSTKPEQNLAPRAMRVGLGGYDEAEEDATYIETIFNGSVLDGSFAPTNNVKTGVYNISGQKIADTADNLPAGIYVVNGKKVIVK